MLEHEEEVTSAVSSSPDLDQADIVEEAVDEGGGAANKKRKKRRENGVTLGRLLQAPTAMVLNPD
jgi:hypothetical protein